MIGFSTPMRSTQVGPDRRISVTRLRTTSASSGAELFALVFHGDVLEAGTAHALIRPDLLLLEARKGSQAPLEYVPEHWKVIRHVRPKYSCASCAQILQAPAPSRPIQRGLAGRALLAHACYPRLMRFCTCKYVYS